jgi:Ca2+/Na+ antiporter
VSKYISGIKRFRYILISLVFLQLSLMFFVRRIHEEYDVFSQLNLIFIFSICILLIVLFLNSDIRKSGSSRVLLLCGVCALYTTYSLQSTLLLNVDRSRSFYVLAWVDRYPISSQNLESSILENVRSPEKVSSFAIEQRIDEQIRRGYIREKSGILDLTSKGSFMLKLSELLAQMYRLQNWNTNSK